jgi:LacI family transcriptional regulator
MSAPGDASYLRADIRHGLIIVAMDRPIEGLDVDTVTADNETGAREAVNRLLAAGHRRVAAVVGDTRIWPLARRLDGYRAALQAAGLTVDEALISTAHDAAQARVVMQALLELSDPPTAVFAAHHRVGRGVMRAMHDTGSSLDLAVFDGVDDNDLLVTPPLVVAGSGPDRVGQLAAELLVERLGGLQGPPRHAVLAPFLIGPDEVYVPNVGAVGRGGLVRRRPASPGAHPPLGSAATEHAYDGSVSGTRARRRTTRTERSIG